MGTAQQTEQEIITDVDREYDKLNEGIQGNLVKPVETKPPQDTHPLSGTLIKDIGGYLTTGFKEATTGVGEETHVRVAGSKEPASVVKFLRSLKNRLLPGIKKVA